MPKPVEKSKEEQMVEMLNEKKVKDLNKNLKSLLKQMYGHLDKEAIIYSNLIGGFQKPTFYIEYNMQRKFINLKDGKPLVLHQEEIKTFIMFLRSLGLSKRAQQTLLYFHFGDGTMDGTGLNRIDYNKLLYKLKNRLEELNTELNLNKEIIKSIVERVIFKGAEEGNIEADYLYYGDQNYGILCSKKQIFRHIERMEWHFLDIPHIGPLQFRPHARYINKRISKENSRWKVDLWWNNLPTDLEYISDRYPLEKGG